MVGKYYIYLLGLDDAASSGVDCRSGGAVFSLLLPFVNFFF